MRLDLRALAESGSDRPALLAFLQRRSQAAWNVGGSEVNGAGGGGGNGGGGDGGDGGGSDGSGGGRQGLTLVHVSAQRKRFSAAYGVH